MEDPKLSLYVRKLRRELHRIPEVGGEERRTSQILREELDKKGIPYKVVGAYGIVGTIPGTAPGKTLLLRADIDGLPMAESGRNLCAQKAVVSEIDGYAHMCGHDCHAAMLMAAVHTLWDMREGLCGTIVFCFEPGEENGYGYPYILEELEHHTIDGSWAIHVEPELECGVLSVRAGDVMAAPISFAVRLKGRGAHASAPHLAISPLSCMASVITALGGIVSWEVDAKEKAVLSIGYARAGDAGNIIPETAEIVGTIRYFDPAVGQQIKAALDRTVRGIAQAYRCQVEIAYQGEHIVPVKNDPFCAEIAQNAIERRYGAKALQPFPAKMGSDGMGIFMQRYPGVYALLGVGNRQKGMGAPLHSPCFDVDEDALPVGVGATIAFASAFLQQGALQ